MGREDVKNHCETSSRVTPLSISAAGCSDKGHVRENNEDAIALCDPRIHFEQSNWAHCICWLMVQEATQQARSPATIEVEVLLMGGEHGTAAIPSGASTTKG